MLEVGFACCIVDVLEALVVGLVVLDVGVVVVVACGLSLGYSTLFEIFIVYADHKLTFSLSSGQKMIFITKNERLNFTCVFYVWISLEFSSF